MFYKTLDYISIARFKTELFKAFKDNSLILDQQCELHFDDEFEFSNFLLKYVEASDSMVIGLFDNNKCQGYVILDNIRITEDNSCAQVHLAISKSLRGKKALQILKEIRDNSNLEMFYCEIPSIAIHAINVCKKLGFKKTGYIPNNLPYTNAFGQTKMYDTYILVYRSDINEVIKKELEKIIEEVNI